jgi:exosortase
VHFLREIATESSVTTSRKFELSDEGARELDSGDRWRLRLVLIGVGLATITAFRSVLIAPFGLIDLTGFDYWFFIPDRDSGALSVLIACWLIWNRRERFMSIRTQVIDWTRWAAAVSVLILFIWAAWMRVQVQLIPILCVFMATLAVAWGGRSGLRLVAMPCAALLLAFPPPGPLQAEIIWRLQGLTVDGANLLLTLAGYSVQREGTELRMGGHAFVIIEACSGWRGIQVLSLVGLAASELRGLSLRRGIWVILAALPLGIALNVARACVVMLTQEELRAEFFDSHTPQGVAVLSFGSVILYGIAALVQRNEPEVDVASPRNPGMGQTHSPDRFAGWAAFSLTVPILLALISVLAPLIQEPLERRARYQFIFPTSLPPWIGTPLDLDYFFPYSANSNSQFHVDYRRTNQSGGGEAVDLFIARELPTPSGLDRMSDSKLLLPSSDWTIKSRRFARVWVLGIDAERAIVSRGAGSQSAYVIAWRLHDRGAIRESLRSLLIPQDCKMSPNECLRTVVRIVVPIDQDDEKGEYRAERTATRFIDSFVLPLKTLEII